MGGRAEKAEHPPLFLRLPGPQNEEWEMGLRPGKRKTKIPLVPGPVPSSKFRLSQEERLSQSLSS